MKKPNLLKLSLLSTLFLSTSIFASPLKPETRSKLVELRAAIDSWAPMCHGNMALSKDCYQFDMIEFAGFRCITGDLERCNDIKEAQAADGRFWRAKVLINETKQNSFSRDMFMGLMMYFSKTKDKDSLQRWEAYLESHKNKMCDDATDNRCNLLPSSWGMLGLLHKHLGMKQTFKMKLGQQILVPEMLVSAATAPRGFMLMLVADNLYFLRSIGYNTDWMKTTAKILLSRQPENPMLQYLVHGSTEELAQNILNACPTQASQRQDDIFWQRRLDRNENGDIIIIRDDWGPQNTRFPVREMADGHDCLVLLNLALRTPF